MLPIGVIGVLADDLIWASRLIEAVRRAGASPLRLGGAADLDRALSELGGEPGGSAEPTPSAEPGGRDDPVGSTAPAGGHAPGGRGEPPRSAEPGGSDDPGGSTAPAGGHAPGGSDGVSGRVTAGSATVPLRGVIVDLLGRRYDGVAAVERVALAGLPVIAVAEHDDLATRKRALAAGAGRVFSYNKFSTDGARLVAAWLSADGGEP